MKPINIYQLTNANNHQQGAVLVVTLVFLAIISVAAASAMQMTRVDSQISGNFIDKQVAFSAADSAMAEATKALKSIAADFDEETIDEVYSSACVDGHCFDGSYPGSGGTVEDCSLNEDSWSPDDGIFQDQAVWDRYGISISKNLGAATAAKYLIEFRCFGDSTDEPKFRLIALGTGKAPGARTMLISEYEISGSSLVSSVSAVMAVNGEMKSQWGTSIETYYCSTGCQKDADGNFNSIFDPDSVSSIAYSSCVDDSCDDSLTTGIVNKVTCTAYNGGGKCKSYNWNDHDYYPPSTVAQQSGDDFFEQYFAQSKEDVQDRSKTLVIDLDASKDGPNAFNNLTTAQISAYDTVYVKGDVQMNSAYNTLFSVLKSDHTLVIDGNMSNTGAGRVSAGFTYVTGDIDINAAVQMDGFMGVEGNADIYGSLSMFPSSNPLATNYSGGTSSSQDLAVQSWYQTNMKF
jgi:type IV pilus assembly protein PilX